MANIAAPPNRAPTATAPVFTGAALGLVAVVAVELAASVTELTRELTELVKEARAEVRESRSEPVAVASSDEKDDRRLAASLVMELTWEEAADEMEDATELECVDSDERRDDRDDARVPVAVWVTVWAWVCVSCSVRDTTTMVMRPTHRD